MNRKLTKDEEDNLKKIYLMITKAIASSYQVGIKEVRSKVRGAPQAAEARHVAFWCYKQVTGDSYKHIGRVAGRTHGAVIHAFKAVEDRRRKDWFFANKVNRLVARFEKMILKGLNNYEDDAVDDFVDESETDEVMLKGL